MFSFPDGISSQRHPLGYLAHQEALRQINDHHRNRKLTNIPRTPAYELLRIYYRDWIAKSSGGHALHAKLWRQEAEQVRYVV